MSLNFGERNIVSKMSSCTCNVGSKRRSPILSCSQKILELTPLPPHSMHPPSLSRRQNNPEPILQQPQRRIRLGRHKWLVLIFDHWHCSSIRRPIHILPRLILDAQSPAISHRSVPRSRRNNRVVHKLLPSREICSRSKRRRLRPFNDCANPRC